MRYFPLQKIIYYRSPTLEILADSWLGNLVQCHCRPLVNLRTRFHLDRKPRPVHQVALQEVRSLLADCCGDDVEVCGAVSILSRDSII